MPYEAITSRLQQELFKRQRVQLRPELKQIVQKLFAALAFGESATQNKIYVVTGGPGHGKQLVSSTALTALAYHHNEDPTLLPLIVVKLDHSFKKDAFRELVRQVQKSLSKDDLSKGYKVVVARAKQPSKLPLKTSHDYCESSFHKITEHTCLIIILDDFEHFVNDGDKGVLGRLFQLLSDDTRKVKLLGLTRQFQIQSMLIEKGYLHGYFMEIFEIPRISLTDFNAEDSPLHQMALMLQVPDNDFTEEAVAWNTAVQNALLCLSKDIPQAMQLASDDGTLNYTHLVSIAQIAVRQAAARQAVLQQADILKGVAARLGQAHAPGLHCSQSEASMLACVFRRKLMHDKLPLNFETIYTEYTEVEKTFALTPRYNESQAWTAFKGLLDEHMLQYVDARQLDEDCPLPPDHRTFTVALDLSEARTILAAACISEKDRVNLLKICTGRGYPTA